LKNGIVDAAENNTPSYSSEGHYKIAPYYSLTGHSMAPDILVMSRQTWDKLTHAEQELVRSAARESVTMMRDMWAQREERVEASLKLAGIRFGDISAAERARFAAAVEPVYARFAAEPRQQDLIKRIRALQ
jgi:TRAP-type C4-dicarboxylate transport system substrate-binding protein